MEIVIPEVAAGVRLLDEKRPGWELKVDPDVLDLMCTTSCVIGQLWQADQVQVPAHLTYWEAGCYDLFGVGDYGAMRLLSHQHGFSVSSVVDDDGDYDPDMSDEKWQATEQVWRDVIRERRASATE